MQTTVPGFYAATFHASDEETHQIGISTQPGALILESASAELAAGQAYRADLVPLQGLGAYTKLRRGQMTRRALAERAGVLPSTVWSAERGEQGAFENADRMHRALGSRALCVAFLDQRSPDQPPGRLLLAHAKDQAATGQFLREQRTERGVTQRELASQLYMSVDSIARIETVQVCDDRHRPPRLITMLPIFQALGILMVYCNVFDEHGHV